MDYTILPEVIAMTAKKQVMTPVQALSLAALVLDFEAEDAQQRQAVNWMHEMKEAAVVLRKMRDLVQARLQPLGE